MGQKGSSNTRGGGANRPRNNNKPTGNAPKSRSSGASRDTDRSSGVVREIGGICVIVLGVLLGIFCYFRSGGLLASVIPILFGVLGVGMYIVPIVLIACGVMMIAFAKGSIKRGTIICAAVILISTLTMIHIGINVRAFDNRKFGEFITSAYNAGLDFRGGGFVGGLFAYLLVSLLGTTGSFVLLGGIVLIMIMLITHLSLRSAGKRARDGIKNSVENARVRRKNELYNERLEEPARDEGGIRASRKKETDDTGFIVHSGKPLTAGDSDYGTPINTSGRNKPTKQPKQQKKVKQESELEFFPISGTIKTEKPKRRRGEEELKPSFNIEMGMPIDENDNEPEYGNEIFEIPMNPSFSGRGYAGKADADDLFADVEIEDANEILRGDVYGDVDPSAAPDFGGGDTATAPMADDVLAGVTVTRMEDDIASNATADGGATPVITKKPLGADGEAGVNQITAVVPAMVVEYQRPPFSLLSLPDPTSAVASESPTEKARVLIETLNSFSISARIINISVGPVITRFELQPAQGIRVNRITTLSNDIALALAAPRVRIEAPIPGKAAIGIEIPNKETAPVLLREVLETREFSAAKSPLTFALGKDIAGKVLLADLEKMPHMLIAGQTGSGKSVCISDIILSMVFKSSPKDVRMILIDPKVVELSIFSVLPHLFCPVVTEPKKAAGALRWAVTEMEQRYAKMGKINARDIYRYNSLQENEDERWPRLVIIIDELADLMMVASKDVEEAICRIAQLGRACGIHLIVATQRPSVDVITGLIKANIPSRIAFAVSNATDSRVILDAGGAEKLLGKGDMLFHANGASKPIRAQCSFVSDEEVEGIAEFFSQNKVGEVVYDQSVLSEITVSSAPHGQGNGKQEDDLLPDAVRVVIESGAASISMIQRRLRVGYARAARLVDIMEQMKYVSASDGSKPRKVLIDASEYNRVFGGNLQIQGGEDDEA